MRLQCFIEFTKLIGLVIGKDQLHKSQCTSCGYPRLGKILLLGFENAQIHKNNAHHDNENNRQEQRYKAVLIFTQLFHAYAYFLQCIIRAPLGKAR